MLAMLWQGMVLARPGSTVNALADLEHAALHWQEAGHHHHDDGSYHVDDTSESVQHVIADHLWTTAALFAAAGQEFPPATSASPRGLHEGPPPHPFLEGPLRPPRFRS